MSQPNLFKFNFKVQNEKRKKDDEQSDSVVKKNCKYDKEKRKRTFQSQWTNRFPWVKCDNTESGEIMYCHYCRVFSQFASVKSALFIGTKNIRIDPLIYHDRTSEHLTCAHKFLTSNWASASENKALEQVELEYRDKICPAENIIFKALTKLDEEEKRKMLSLFNTAYAVSKKGKPFSDYVFCLEVQQLNGFIQSENYRNIHSCTMFLDSIAKVMREKIKSQMKQVNFISILADGSTDSSVIEQEIIYLSLLIGVIIVAGLAGVICVCGGLLLLLKNRIVNKPNSGYVINQGPLSVIASDNLINSYRESARQNSSGPNQQLSSSGDAGQTSNLRIPGSPPSYDEAQSSPQGQISSSQPTALSITNVIANSNTTNTACTSNVSALEAPPSYEEEQTSSQEQNSANSDNQPIISVDRQETSSGATNAAYLSNTVGEEPPPSYEERQTSSQEHNSAISNNQPIQSVHSQETSSGATNAAYLSNTVGEEPPPSYEEVQTLVQRQPIPLHTIPPRPTNNNQGNNTIRAKNIANPPNYRPLRPPKSFEQVKISVNGQSFSFCSRKMSS